MTTLGDLVILQGGGTPSRDEPAFWGGSIPWASVKDLTGPRLTSTVERISPAGVAASATSIIRAGHVVVATRMAVGRSALLQVDAAINQDLKALIPRGGKRVHPNYLLHLLRASTPFLERRATGATVKGIRSEVLESLPVPHSEYDEQRRIADVLDKADAVRRMRNEAIGLTEELLRSVFLEMVGPGASDYSKWPVRTVESLAARAPNAMRTGPFGSDLRHSEFVDEGIAVLGIDNAVQNRFAWRERRFITQAKYETLRRYTVYAGDVIVTIMGTTGRSAVVPDDIPTAITTKHLAAITLDPEKANPELVSQALFRHPEVLSQIAVANRGAIMSGLNLGLIKGLRVPVPPIGRQREFASATTRIRGLAEKMSDGSEADVLFESLTARAFPVH